MQKLSRTLLGCDGLSARRMAVLYTFHEPSLGRPVHHEFMRSALLDVTPIIAATACYQRNYVERYSRFIEGMMAVENREEQGLHPTASREHMSRVRRTADIDER